jgi:hypothetical protein
MTNYASEHSFESGDKQIIVINNPSVICGSISELAKLRSAEIAQLLLTS